VTPEPGKKNQMNIDLNRIRYQETYGDHLGDYLEETVTREEIMELLQRYATEWFPEGHALEQDPDSSNTWKLTDTTEEQRHVYFFIESIG
jgi:hypothetical protein